jgi:hypothetical protein
MGWARSREGERKGQSLRGGRRDGSRGHGGGLVVAGLESLDRLVHTQRLDSVTVSWCEPPRFDGKAW